MTQFKDKSDSGRVRVRRAVHLPGADGGRHPPLRHRPGARGRRPAPAPRAHPRRRQPLQQPLRRHVRGARGRPSRKAGARVMDLQEPDPQDVEVRSTRRQGTILVLDDPAVIEQEDQAGRHRHRGRGPLRPGEPSRACRTCCRSSPRATDGDPPDAAPRATRSTGRSRPTPPRRWSSCSRPIQARYAELAADPGGTAAACSARARPRPSRHRAPPRSSGPRPPSASSRRPRLDACADRAPSAQSSSAALRASPTATGTVHPRSAGGARGPRRR